ncbi:serine/threonine-protein kinase Smg1 isoform X2 [Lutzomyia longipalpis]|uniref:serine/threonine-protein kinase Smg1 isoform X2 n=1 Tax=Lutzomyia longipalpis TaxID=7200 RepID=UPI0024841D19|nr:serine/threonine-protein kinase Smg1 isoform X2 [Lutzomyia longipalpis]
MEEDGMMGAPGTSGAVRVVRKSKVTQVLQNEKKHSSPDRYGSASNLAKTRSDASSFGFPEDMRISKLMNRLCAERSVEGALDLCGKLKGVIVDPTNSNYIRRSFDGILEGCVEVLLDGPKECQVHVVEILAKIGVVMRGEFSQFTAGILKVFKGNKGIKGLMMGVLRGALEVLQEQGIQVSSQIPKLLDTLKDFLEKTDNVEVFTSVSSVIDTIAANYPTQFRPFFTDTVDILVGWHLETDQSLRVRDHCAKILENFRPFWRRDIKFTVRLLDQIIEDIVLKSEDLGSQEAEQFVIFASFVAALNTIVKCIDVSCPEAVAAIGEDFLFEGYAKVLPAAKVAIQHCPQEEEVTLTVNEFIALLFDTHGVQFDASREDIQSLIEMQLQRVQEYSRGQMLSLIFIILRFLRAMKTRISMEFIELLLVHPHLRRERFSRDGKCREALVKLWQEIVDVKNVAILERAYSVIIEELNAAVLALRASGSTQERWKFLIVFHLNGLARLAASSTSIIALYALRPSLLEMLTTNLCPADEIWLRFPVVHHAILTLLVAHCSNNGNFISSSGLLAGKVTPMMSLDRTESPTTDNFETILSTIDTLLQQAWIPRHSQNLLLEWCHQMILQAAAHCTILRDNPTFCSILQSILDIPTKANYETKIKSGGILSDFLDKFVVVNEKIFPGLAEICCIEMCSTSSQIRELYSQIFAKIPLNVSLRQVNEFTGKARQWDAHIREMQQWHKSAAVISEIWPDQFRDFLEVITFSSSGGFCDRTIREMFKRAWVAKSSCGEYDEAVLRDIRCLVAWIQWEAAQFCVANKLRTPFGKPQETFLRIEAIVKEDARILDLKETTTVAGIETVLANQRHARILLGFMEALEKAIYSATEGTAFALPSPEKPSRTFFHVNSSTCNEWFNRIRTAVDLVALHCMEPEMVIRYSESTIRNLVEAQRVAEPLFEHTLMSLAWALLRNGESDSLSGLYTWIKKISGRRLVWVKMAAEQAAGHRETAAAGYTEILEADQKLDKHIREFIVDQLVQCLMWSAQWEKLAVFLENEEARTIPRATIPLINITSKQVRCIMRYDEDQSIAEECLANWDILSDETEFTNNFSCHHIFSLAENTVTCIFPGKSISPNVLQTCSKTFQNGLQEALRTHSQEHLNNLTILNHICHKIKIGDDSVDSLSVDKIFGSLTLTRILYFAEFFCGSERKVDDLNAMLRLDMVSMSRKEGNLQLCRRELERYYARTSNAESLEAACEAIMAHKEAAVWDLNLGRAVYETSKWLYCYPEKRDFAVQFTAATALGIRGHIASGGQPDPQISERGARILLSISEWLIPEDEKQMQLQMPLGQLLNQLPDVKPTPDFDAGGVIPLTDLATGKLIGASVKQCPDLAKAWNAFGGWCYKWGRKMVENRPSATIFQPADIAGISQAIPDASQEEISQAVGILSEHQVPMEIDDIEPGDGSSTDLLESHIRNIPSFAHITSEQLQAIIGIWRRAHKHVYGYYEMAADAYFKYLQLGTCGKVDEDSASSTVAATLRLLRLIVKHALGLQEVLEEGLASTPTSPWKVIIPQLFSRLNHHEPYVRRRVSELLCRVAEDSPHIIIFPAVVGAAQGAKSEASNTLSECFYSLLDTLSNQAADTVAQVQLLVRELRRVCLLWDEMCLVSMSQTYVASSKKFSELDDQITKEGITDTNYGTFSELYHQLMKPVVATMDKIRATISREAETKHEAAFQEKFSKPIGELSDLLRQPMRRDAPLMPWMRFKSLCGVFQQRVQKRSNNVLKMSDISPTLAGFKDTVISMPGVENSGKEQIHIRSVDNMVQILNTKTKPKKLAFHGSDGNRYTYLFKGLEDLHLDERIMQFLSIANSMMSRTIDCNGNVSSYRARHYSVIPLGPQSGLISWVDGVLPIFSVYKKWQQREAAKPRKEKEISPIMRPSELFFSKLTPKLQEKGMKVTDARSTWPIEVLREVLTELAAETPRDLLSREFWCTSTTAAEWRQIVRNYSLSLAVMSVIGYIIGLGDRHLDNILVNLSTGEIVHIDYNVCFEKGKTLRVPEKTPFRMTQNLENALGVTGIEGTFRLACENVLKALKRGRETLLTLLEAFVYDPLVDWAVGEDDDTTPNGTEVKQINNGEEKEMLKLRWSTMEVLEELKQYTEPIQKVAMEVNKLDEQKTVLKKRIELIRNLQMVDEWQRSEILSVKNKLKNIEKHKEDTHAFIQRNIERFRGKAPEFPCKGVNVPKWDEFDALHYNVEVNEFERLKYILPMMHRDQLYADHKHDIVSGHVLCKEMGLSMKEELQILEGIFEQFFLYNGVMPLIRDEDCYKRRHDVFVQCEKLMEENKFKLAQQKAHELRDRPCEMWCNGYLDRFSSITEYFIQQTSPPMGLLYQLSQKQTIERRYDNILDESFNRLNGNAKGFILVCLTKNIPNVLENILDPEIALKAEIQGIAFVAKYIDRELRGINNHLISNINEIWAKVKNIWEFLENFAKDIALETLLRITNDDASILQMITMVSSLQHDDVALGQIISDAIDDLNGTAENSGCYSATQTVGMQIEEKFESLIGEYSEVIEKTAGEKLLLKINETFPDVKDFQEIVSNLMENDVLEKVQEVDVVASGKRQMEIQQNPEKGKILRRIWTLKKLEAIIEFFTCILQIACAFRRAGAPSSDMYQHFYGAHERYVQEFLHQIVSPIAKYCSGLIFVEFLEKNGIDWKKNGTTHGWSLTELLNASQGEFMRRLNDQIGDEEHFERFSIIEYFTSKYAASVYLDVIRWMKVRTITLKIVGSAYEWRFEDEGGTSRFPTRKDFVENIKKMLDTVGTLEISIQKMYNEMSSLHEKLSGVLPMFGLTAFVRRDNMEKLSKFTKIAIENYNVILKYENINSDLVETDNALYGMTSRISFVSYEGLIKRNKLIEFIPDDQEITFEWVDETETSLERQLWDVQKAKNLLNEDIKERWQNIGIFMEKLQRLNVDFVRISTDIRGLLKSSLRMEGKHQSATKEYLLKCKSFATTYENLLESLRKEALDGKPEEVLEQIAVLQREIDGIFEGPSDLKKYHHEAFAAKNEENGRLGKTRDQSLQKRNAYGVSVWRRIRLKLEGRDPEATRRSTVPEQVDWMIREAMDIDNLSVLYEGWTPWV